MRCKICEEKEGDLGRRSKHDDEQARYLLVHLAQHPRLAHICHINKDIISRVPVQRRPQPLLIQMVSNETNAPAEHEQAVQGTDLDVLVSLLRGERSTVPEQIDEAHSDASIDVQDEGVLLGGGDLLDGEGVVEERVRGEVLADVLLDELDTKIGVVDALDLVADTADYKREETQSVTHHHLEKRSTH